ncbi:hypothetical protein ABIE13_001976 [Ottowia thiooxydans]|uniref:Secreted protein n=1 Tax=Ottowia thiooxydans TaxID=219182 RepID=A0ABV2Q8E5_9BURK
MQLINRPVGRFIKSVSVICLRILAITLITKKKPEGITFGLFFLVAPIRRHYNTQWNCSSSVEPVSALTLEEPPWMTVVTSSK